MNDGWALALQLAATLGVGALLQKVAEKWMGRRAAHTDDAAKLTASAMSLLEPYRDELMVLRKQLVDARVEIAQVRDQATREVADLRAKVTHLEAAQVRHHHLVHAHMMWDHRVIRDLVALGGEVVDPPPLLAAPILPTPPAGVDPAGI